MNWMFGLRVKVLTVMIITTMILGTMIASVPFANAFSGQDFTIVSNPAQAPPAQPGMTSAVNITITNNSTTTDTGITVVSNSTTACTLSPAAIASISPGANANSTLTCTSSKVQNFAVNVTGTDSITSRVHWVLVMFFFRNQDFFIVSNPANPQPAQPGMKPISANVTITNNSPFTDTAITLTSNSTSGCTLTPLSLGPIAKGQSANSTLTCMSAVLATFVINVTATDTVSSSTHSVFIRFFFEDLVNLDANSVNPIKNTVTPSAIQAKTFNVGAILNASSTTPINGVFGWQFQINYNATAFTPQGDPNPAGVPGNPSGLYTDGAGPTVNFGAQTLAGTVNWAGLITGNSAFTVVTVNPPVGSAGSILIALTLLNHPTVNISAKTLLANVAFELLSKPGASQPFAITTVLVVDVNSNKLLAGSGTSALETITNSPPTASFTVTPLVKGDASCTPITGSPCSPYAFKFDGTSSSSTVGTAAGTAGFFWDFGDTGTIGCGTGATANGGCDGFYLGSTYSGGGICTNANAATFTCQGAVAIHDYGAPGQFSVTLRVVDSLGATGSARDSLGGVITNLQPSHTSVTIVAANGFLITARPPALSLGPQAGVLGTTVLTLTSVTTGFHGTVSLSAMITPSGSNAPTWTFNTTSVNVPVAGSVAASLTVSAGTLTPRVDYNITVMAAIGPIINNITIPIIPSTIKVSPVQVIGVTSGHTFTVSINANAALLFGWQFQLNYNQTMLQARLTSVTFGPFWAAASGSGHAILLRQVNQTAGKILVAGTLFGTQPFTGNVTLATLNFTVYGTGITTLALSNDFLINNVGLGQSLQFSQTNGVFCNLSACLSDSVAVTSLTVSSSSVNPGTAVTVSAKVTNYGLNPENVTISIKAGTTTIISKQVILNPGNSTVLTAPWNTTGISSGPYIINASVAINGATNQNPSTSASTTVTLNSPGTTFPIIYLIAGLIAAAAAIVIAALLILRRRRLGQSANTGQGSGISLAAGKG